MNSASVLIRNTRGWIKCAILLAGMLMLNSTPAFAQSSDKTALQNKYDKLQDEIKDAEDLLNSTKKKKENSMNELKLLNRKIDMREEVITTIAQQVTSVNTELTQTNRAIQAMQDDISELKKQYAQMVYYTYVHDQDYKPLHFIFSAESINDAFQRVQYIRSFHGFRKDQITAIEDISEDLQAKIAHIENEKVEKESLLAKEEKEKKKLDDEKSKKDSALKKLSTQEKDLKKQIDKKKKDAVSLKNKIQAIIAEEIKKEKQRAAEEAAKKEAEAKKAAEKANTTTGTTTTPQTPVQTKEKPAEQINLGLTPEMQLISKNFSGNKGKLPWPVERGTITERFGTHPHPVLKDVMVENNGIDIATADGSLVRSIFDGEVVNVIFNPSFQKGVIIKHGEYYSVYTNLSDVTVKAGDKVTTKQKIGTAWEDPEEGKTEVHLEIWKGTVILDPALWISK
ncbi:MAG TPA: peptidoglycan DD-metalloendopeptidase family protein [Chitinophagales bacterium]|nr:peptidoglycan DD-metalloendopeptidase family protein [Chitinophagales bacterium]